MLNEEVFFNTLDVRRYLLTAETVRSLRTMAMNTLWRLRGEEPNPSSGSAPPAEAANGPPPIFCVSQDTIEKSAGQA